MQKSIFFQKELRVTQGPYVGSHKGSPAMDFGGLDGGKDKCYAPFDAKVIRTRRENGEVYIESLEPVQTPSGVKTVNMLFIHDSNIKVGQGQVIRQGQHFYTEGGQGGGKPNAFANHVHVEGGFGASPARQEKNKVGTWVLPHAVPLETIFFMPESIKLLNSGGIKWARSSDNENTQTEGENMKIGIYKKTNKAVSSALLKDGAFALMGESGKLDVYARRMAKEVTDANLSSTYEGLRDKEMQKGEIVAVTEN